MCSNLVWVNVNVECLFWYRKPSFCMSNHTFYQTHTEGVNIWIFKQDNYALVWFMCSLNSGIVPLQIFSASLVRLPALIIIMVTICPLLGWLILSCVSMHINSQSSHNQKHKKVFRKLSRDIAVLSVCRVHGDVLYMMQRQLLHGVLRHEPAHTNTLTCVCQFIP